MFEGLVKEEGEPEETPKGKEGNQEHGLEAQGRGSPGRKQFSGPEEGCLLAANGCLVTWAKPS